MNKKRNKRSRIKIGELLLAQGIIDEDQLNHALSEHKRTGLQLGKIFTRLGMVDDETLTSILGQQLNFKTRKRLGDILIDRGKITEEQLEEGIKIQQNSDKKLGVIFTEMGLINEEELVELLSAQMEIDSIKLSGIELNDNALSVLSEEMCREYDVIPLFIRNEILTIGMVDPTNLRTLDHIKFKAQMDVEPVMVAKSELKEILDKVYAKDTLDQLFALEGEGLETVSHDDSYEEEEELTDEEGAQVVKFVTTIINEAIGRGASDIHLEPQETNLRLRYRIDGVLLQMPPIPGRLMGQILSRIKIMSNMDIAERRKPLDGRFTVRYKKAEVDLRVSTFPSILRKRGVVEKIVMRILDPNSGQLPLNKMGIRPEVFKMFLEQIKQPNGIILVTGPTGSGKSTTLYSCIREILSPEINITTMEDPVELNIEGVTQGQINKDAGFTFGAGIRAILRQDPDVIMIGEMRDYETAAMAIESALTGHLVFSTLHTNNSAGAFPRLLEMGLEPFLVSTAVRGVLAQRLVRRICKYCKEPFPISDEVKKNLGVPLDSQFYHGKGCPKCDNTGYKGRAGIYEILVPNEKIRDLINARSSASVIKEEAIKNAGLVTLRVDGIGKALEGITTLEAALNASESDTE